MGPMRVALISTAHVNQPGSMRAYADVLMQALSRHAPEIEPRLLELDPRPTASGWQQRATTLALPWRARRSHGFKPDLWHVLDGSRAYVAFGLRSAPVVITAHDIIPVLQQRGHFPGAPSVGRAAGWLWRRNGAELCKAQAVVCVSESTRRDVDTAFGPISAAQVVPLPVRPQLADQALGDIASSREPGTLLHVGNNSFYKNRAQVLRIFAASDRTLARRLVMVGSPPSTELRGLAEDLGITDALHWVVDADDSEVAKWYRTAAVLVFPSRYEGFGWPVLEAMAFGLPVVCSNAGSLPEVVGGSTTCLTESDVSGFVAAIEELLRDPQLHRQQSQVVRSRAREFSMERFAAGTYAAYRSAIDAWSRL